MKNVIGIVFLFVGIAGYLRAWICEQKEKQTRLEEFMDFLQKTIFAMKTEKVRIIEYLENYIGKDEVLMEVLHEIAYRLKKNIYPDGRIVWEEVLKEWEQKLNFDQETFAYVLRTGNGFFGSQREENLCFLQRSLKELEIQKQKNSEKYKQERKVWIPVGLLGGVMLSIILI